MEKVDQQNEFFQQPPQISETSEPVVASAMPVKYAGFWIRWAAAFIDSMIVGSIIAAIIFGIGYLIKNPKDSEPSTVFFLILPVVQLLVLVLIWAYFVIFTYKKEATLGKKMFGLKVISAKSEKLSLGQVILRETIGKIISGIILNVGYIMAGFTEKKQALHDMIAKTNVVYKDPNKKIKAWPIIVVVVVFFAIILGLPTIIAMVSLSSARGKAYDSSVKSSLASVVPLAIAFSNENGSLIGFDPAANPTFSSNFPACSDKPIVNISSDGSQMAIFAKLCSDKKKYFCVDTVDMGQEVDESYALSGKETCSPSAQSANNLKLPTNGPNSDSASLNQDNLQAGQGASEMPPVDLGQINGQIIGYINAASDALEAYKKVNGTYKGFSPADSEKNYQFYSKVDYPNCKSEMKIDITPDGNDYVIHWPLCSDPSFSNCFERRFTEMGTQGPIRASTSFVEKNYKCN